MTDSSRSHSHSRRENVWRISLMTIRVLSQPIHSILIAEIEIGDTQDFHIEITTERGATYVEASAFDAD